MAAMFDFQLYQGRSEVATVYGTSLYCICVMVFWHCAIKMLCWHSLSVVALDLYLNRMLTLKW